MIIARHVSARTAPSTRHGTTTTRRAHGGCPLRRTAASKALVPRRRRRTCPRHRSAGLPPAQAVYGTNGALLAIFSRSDRVDRSRSSLPSRHLGSCRCECDADATRSLPAGCGSVARPERAHAVLTQVRGRSSRSARRLVCPPGPASIHVRVAGSTFLQRWL